MQEDENSLSLKSLPLARATRFSYRSVNEQAKLYRLAHSLKQKR
ncbi:hypothetical protein [Helicobacter suis]|nr:hypothetical protein [Helicobacter suis]GFK17359.1 hypothetical protein NHP190033_15350 [Helicobacter suis]